MRSKLDQELDLLNYQLISMGSMCEDAIKLAMKSLFEKNIDLAINAIEMDKKVDCLERDIESLCLRLLLQQHPVAKDFRIISAALKMISDIERIGDQASDIAEISEYISDKTIKSWYYIKEMADASIKMVTKSIDSFVKRDIELANEVINDDDIVDDLFVKTKAAIINDIIEKSDDGENYLDLFMISKYLERVADHATNIAEWVLYSITGKHDEMNE